MADEHLDQHIVVTDANHHQKKIKVNQTVMGSDLSMLACFSLPRLWRSVITLTAYVPDHVKSGALVRVSTRMAFCTRHFPCRLSFTSRLTYLLYAYLLII